MSGTTEAWNLGSCEVLKTFALSQPQKKQLLAISALQARGLINLN